MSLPYSAFCEDYYVNMRLGSQLQLPQQRETVLSFFERMQKDFPGMSRFRKTESGDMSMEEDRNENTYRWVTMESNRLSSGHVNPPSLESAMKLHCLTLQLAPAYLGLSPVEIDYLDVLFGFDLSFSGNHDEIVSESLLDASPLACLAETAGAKVVDFQPTVTVALSDDCRLQARIDVVTRTNSHQVRTGEYSEEAISVYLVVRRYWGDRPNESLERIALSLAERADALAVSHLLPRVLRPLSSAIASRS